MSSLEEKVRQKAKITFLGDAMCQGPMLAPYAMPNGGYDFSRIFSEGVRDMLAQSDFVVANLETPIAPDDEHLTDERYRFCSPIEFAQAVKDAGIDYVFTANNHCLDRGPAGILRTIEALDRVGLGHTGTFASREESVAPSVVEVNGFRVGLMSYTYGTNAFANDCYLDGTNRFMVNLFQEQELTNPLARAWNSNRDSADGRLYEEFERGNRPENLTLPVFERQEPHERERRDLRAAVARMLMAKPDFTVMGMHAGGQLNPVATKYTKELAEFIRGCGVDWISGTHEHIVHGGDFSAIGAGKLTTYSLGNFCALTGNWEEPFGDLAEFSIAWHVYLERDEDGRPFVAKTSFSVLKTVKDGDEARIRVVPLADLCAAASTDEERQTLQKELFTIAGNFCGFDCAPLGVRPEYTICERSGFTLDANVPAGNIAFERFADGTVHLHQELRDTEGPWFYWAFRVLGAQGRRIDFRFTRSVAVGTRGPFVSLDRGASWSYAAEDGATRNSFSFDFPEGADEVWFYQTIPYLQDDWEAFLAWHAAERGKLFETGVLCMSRKGRAVEKAVFGDLSGKPRYRVFLSARRHCGETMASFVLEGILESVFATDETGDWLRRNVEFMVVPFMDKDGCEDGDQGKNRRPHDHNRDYTEFIYPETRGIRDWIAERAGNVLDIFFDFHCPWLFGQYNEWAYQIHEDDERSATQTSAFGKILEGLQSGGMAYREVNDIRWGVGWNTGANYSAGRSVKQWARAELRCGFVGSFEIPFATANGKVVTPDSCREFGGDIARAFRRYLSR